MKTNRLFEGVFMDIDWSLYDDTNVELLEFEDKTYRAASNAAAKWRPNTKAALVEAIKEELANGNTDLNCIDTSEITDMSQLFRQGRGIELNDEQQASLDMSKWDVRDVRNMYRMFQGCAKFNQDLTQWDVRNVENMSSMFRDCTKFNQDLSGWDVRNVEDMNCMFQACSKLRGKGLPQWNVRRVKYMYRMFWGCQKLNQDLSGWDVRNLVTKSEMFTGCYALRKQKKIPNWY